MKSAFLSIFALGLALIPVSEPRASTGTINVKIIMDAAKPNGNPWDGWGAGGPDPYVKIDGMSYRADRCQDSYVCNIVVSSSEDVVLVEVYDADAQFDDSAGRATCVVGHACVTSGATVVLSR